MKSENYETILNIAREAAQEASEIIMSLYQKAEISDKGTNNLVTEADLKAEAAIRKKILDNFSSHAILGEEEGGESNFESDHLWVIDPLDGTNNYAQGFPFFCISIAYAEKGIVKAGLVFDPIRKELFHAIEGKGAYLDDKPISVSTRDLNQAMVSVGFHYDRGQMMRNTLATIQTLFENDIRGIRRTGSAALDFCYVASGRTDAYMEYFLYAWDFAAGMLIVNEAGGECRDAHGKKLQLTANSIAICNGKFTEELMKLVKYPDKE